MSGKRPARGDVPLRSEYGGGEAYGEKYAADSEYTAGYADYPEDYTAADSPSGDELAPDSGEMDASDGGGQSLPAPWQDPAARQADEANERREFLKLELQMRKMRNRARRRYVLMIAVAFLFAIVLIFRYSLVIEINDSVVREKARLAELQNANGLLRKQISLETDLEKVRLLAETRLGMQKPDKHQIVYIKVPKKDHAVVAVDAQDGGGTLRNPFEYAVEQAALIRDKLFGGRESE